MSGSIAADRCHEYESQAQIVVFIPRPEGSRRCDMDNVFTFPALAPAP